MKQAIFKISCVFISIAVLTTSAMEHQDNQKKLWLETIRQEYKKLNYKKETSFMKEELGRIAYNLRINPSEPGYEDISKLYSKLCKKKLLVMTILALMTYPLYASIAFSLPKSSLNLFLTWCISLFLSYCVKETSQKNEQYGTLILKEIKKEELREEWRRMQNEA